jgi:hypothetical protein
MAYYIAVQQRPWGVFFQGPIFRSNTMINLHFHQPVTVSEKVSQILSAVVLVLTGALALVTFAAS